jgi:glycosyltransferase involved in cell wall biosynthesis
LKSVTRTIFHFILDPRSGGPHAYVQSLQRASATWASFVIVTAGNGPITNVALVNLRHVWFPLYCIEVPINVALIILSSLFGRLAIRDSIFHVHGAANIAPLLAAVLLKRPFIWHFHETYAPFKIIVTLTLPIIKSLRHIIIVVAEASVHAFNLKTYTVLRPPIDLEFWQCKTISKPANAKSFSIVAIGNLNPLKGQDTLLAAIEHFDFVAKVTFVGSELVNQTSYAHGLYAKAQRILQDHNNLQIYFRGWCSSNEIRELFSTADLFVLPSRSEACPIVLLEAMACRKVCLATDVGDVISIIDRKEIGLVCAPDNPASLTLQLIHAQKLSAHERLDIGSNARLRVVELCSAEKIASRYRELVDQLTDSSTPGQQKT